MLDIVVTQHDSPPESRFSARQSPFTDTDALQILLKVNSPGGRLYTPANGSWPSSHDRTGSAVSFRHGAHMSRSATRSRGRRTRLINSGPKEDEEATRTRKFWESWAARATEELLGQVQEKVQAEELLYSGRCGREPKYGMCKSPSTESLNTDISLLACSDLNAEVSACTPRHKKKKRKSKVAAKIGPNWEMFAKEKKGMLDRFILADASRIEGYMEGRCAPVQNCVQRSKATDVMTQQERGLLRMCAFRSGLTLAGQKKSYSTENIMSLLPQPPKKTPPASRHGTPLSGGTGPAISLTTATTTGYDQYNQGGPLQDEEDKKSDFNKTGRTPSPHAIKKNIPVRPVSAVAAKSIEEDRSESGAPQMVVQRTPRSKGSSPRTSNSDLTTATPIPTSPGRKHSTVLGLSDGTFTDRVRHRVQKTLVGLRRATGFGDRTDVCTVIEEEQGIFTGADYAKHPRYPQNIRIAPPLSHVIKEDIKDRMGRPRRHEVKVLDIQAFDMDQPSLGRSHRNLHIFNWLNHTHECEYEVRDVPAIVDLEGQPPPRRSYPQFVPGICGQEDLRGSSAVSSYPTHSVSDDQCDGYNRPNGDGRSHSDLDSNDNLFD